MRYIRVVGLRMFHTACRCLINIFQEVKLRNNSKLINRLLKMCENALKVFQPHLHTEACKSAINHWFFIIAQVQAVRNAKLCQVQANSRAPEPRQWSTNARQANTLHNQTHWFIDTVPALRQFENRTQKEK